MTLSSRVDRIEASKTLEVTVLVDKLRRQGRDIIDLGAGEPDFDTPEIVKEAARDAIAAGYTKYTPVSGVLELREAICSKYAGEFKTNFTPDQVLVTSGAKHAIINTLLALCESGDEVIIPTPYWTSYAQQVRLAEAKTVFVETGEGSGFRLDAQQLEAAITPATKVLMLNSPGNPTGAVYHDSEIRALADVIGKYEFYVISDEIYEKIIYNDRLHTSLASYPELAERVILVNGVSKSCAMTGWRIGYQIASREITKACSKIQSHMTSNACSISQMASLAGLRNQSEFVGDMVSAFQERRDYLVAALNQLPDVTCFEPEGAFYTFPNISAYFGSVYNGKEILSPVDFCAFLLESEGVALVPGEAFGSSRHVRISYATSIETLQQAMQRIQRGLASLSRAN